MSSHPPVSSLPPAYPDRAAWGTATKLRAWQTEALVQYFAALPRDLGPYRKGNTGIDYVFGGSGDDVLNGGLDFDPDFLYGQGGRDLFVTRPGEQAARA